MLAECLAPDAKCCCALQIQAAGAVVKEGLEKAEESFLQAIKDIGEKVSSTDTCVKVR